CRGNAFQVQRGGVTRSVLLVAVDECACLLLLIFQDPVADFEGEISKMPIARCLPPGCKPLHHPRDLPEVSPVSKPVPVILESAEQFVLIKTAIPRTMGGSQSQEDLPREVVLVRIPTFRRVAVRGDPPVHINT